MILKECLSDVAHDACMLQSAIPEDQMLAMAVFADEDGQGNQVPFLGYLKRDHTFARRAIPDELKQALEVDVEQGLSALRDFAADVVMSDLIFKAASPILLQGFDEERQFGRKGFGMWRLLGHGWTAADVCFLPE